MEAAARSCGAQSIEGKKQLHDCRRLEGRQRHDRQRDTLLHLLGGLGQAFDFLGRHEIDQQRDRRAGKQPAGRQLDDAEAAHLDAPNDRRRRRGDQRLALQGDMRLVVGDEAAARVQETQRQIGLA
jgi:hypothetical protein